VFVGPVVAAGAGLPHAGAAIDDAIEFRAGIAIPELDHMARHADEVDLMRNGGLQAQIRAGGRRAKGAGVLRNRAAIFDEAVKARPDLPPRRGIQVDRAAEPDVAAHTQEITGIAAVRLAE